MATPHRLPSPTHEAIQSLLGSLHLPPATTIQALDATAAFHSIHLVHFPSSAADALHPAEARNQDGTVTLVLRLSGDQMPRTKTLNEVAVMRWVSEHTAIPVPAVVRFDASDQNALGCEFTLLERVPGKSVNEIYWSLDEGVKVRLVDQLTDMLLELNKHEWTHIGGLRVSDKGEIVPGPVLEDTFWFTSDIEKYWGGDESIESLNPTGPYASQAAYIRGHLERFVHAITVHPSLHWLRDLLPRLVALSAKLSSIPALSSTRLILAHKDLHFANVMATDDGEITGILDWEFAGVVPAPRWDPVRAFLWSGKEGEESHEEKTRLREVFQSGLVRRGVEAWWTEGLRGGVEPVWTVVKFLRALVEVCPRGERADLVGEWRSTVEGGLTELGV